jgi:hypothetical protein
METNENHPKNWAVKEVEENWRNILTVILAAVILIVGLIVIWRNPKGLVTIPTPTPTATARPTVNIIHEGLKTVLTGFPTDITFPASAILTDNLKYTSPTGQVQLTKMFTSTKAVSDNYTFFYNQFQKSTAWKIVSKLDSGAPAGLMALVATGHGGVLSVNIRNDAAIKKTVIEIDFVPSTK